jgi:hypothetical protein
MKNILIIASRRTAFSVSVAVLMALSATVPAQPFETGIQHRRLLKHDENRSKASFPRLKIEGCNLVCRLCCKSRNLVCRRSIFKLKSLLSEAKIEGCNLVCRFCGKAAILFAGAVFSSSKASFPRLKSRAAILFAGFAAKPQSCLQAQYFQAQKPPFPRLNRGLQSCLQALLQKPQSCLQALLQKPQSCLQAQYFSETCSNVSAENPAKFTAHYAKDRGLFKQVTDVEFKTAIALSVEMNRACGLLCLRAPSIVPSYCVYPRVEFRTGFYR